jgi:curli production assembly/transport component CsgG
MKRLLVSLVTATLLSGCASVHMELAKEEPVALQPKTSLFDNLPKLDGPPITIAVYGFSDKTGQMKPNDRIAVFSKAVTQGSEVFLIKALQDARNWFRVVERVGLDNLVKERQLIRNQREVYEGKDAKPLKPMTVAGVMIEGGIIGYDSNIRSGGNGARFLGIGGSQQYRVDEVVISMRLVSVNSGEVLLTNAVSKTIYSTQHNVGVLRFVDAGTRALELETGSALNEPTTYAIRVAIEQAVYEMIVEGERKGLWRFKKQGAELSPKIEPVKQTEVMKNELVQENAQPKETTPPAAPAQQSNERAGDGVKQESGSDKNSQSNVPVPKKQTQGRVLDWINVRVGQDIKSEKVLNLRPGTVVEVLEQNKGFYFVRFENKEGWVVSKFIKVQK